MLKKWLLLLVALVPLLVARGHVAQHVCDGMVVEIAACCCQTSHDAGIRNVDGCCDDFAWSMAIPVSPSGWPEPPAPVALAVLVAAPGGVAPAVCAVLSLVPGHGFALYERGPPPPDRLYVRNRTLLV